MLRPVEGIVEFGDRLAGRESCLLEFAALLDQGCNNELQFVEFGPELFTLGYKLVGEAVSERVVASLRP